MKKKKKNKTSKLEKFIYKSFVFTTVILIVGIIYSRAALSKINLEVQELSGIIKEETIDKAVKRILAWKYAYKIIKEVHNL